MITIRTETIVEKHEIVIIRFRRRFIRTQCAECGRDVGMIALPDAAALLGYNLETVWDLLQSGRVHIGFNERQETFVCLRSLYLNEDAG